MDADHFGTNREKKSGRALVGFTQVDTHPTCPYCSKTTEQNSIGSRARGSLRAFFIPVKSVVSLSSVVRRFDERRNGNEENDSAGGLSGVGPDGAGRGCRADGVCERHGAEDYRRGQCVELDAAHCFAAWQGGLKPASETERQAVYERWGAYANWNADFVVSFDRTIAKEVRTVRLSEG